MNQPVNRIHKFSDLCDIIATELAVFHDGVENTAEDFREESIVIAESIKKNLAALIANKHPATLHEELTTIFGLPRAEVRPVLHQEDHLSQIWSRNIDRIPSARRQIRRGSIEGNFVSFGRVCDQGLESRTRPPEIIRRIEVSRNSSRPMS